MSSALASGRRPGDLETPDRVSSLPDGTGPEGRSTALSARAFPVLAGTGAVAAYWLLGLVGGPLHEVAGEPGPLASGLALGLLVRRGATVWPLVALGTALVAAGQPAEVLVALVVAATVEAVVGSVVLRRVAGADTRLDRVRDVVVLVAPVGLGSTALGALVAATGLLAGGTIDSGQWPTTFLELWAGHAVGALVVTPLVLVARRSRRAPDPRSAVEPAVCLAVVLALSGWVFSGGFAFPYVIFPALVWVGMRLGVTGTVVATALVGVVASIGTQLERGPFALDAADDRVVGLGVFLCVIAATKLTLAAVVSERRVAERESRRLAADLARSVEELTQANRDLEAFSYSVSHDLRAPLRNIDGFASKLSRRHADELDERGIHYLQRIRANTSSMGNLIDEMLLLSRLQRQRLKTRPVPADAVVRDALTQLESVIAERDVEIEVDPLPTVVADGALLTQVFVNLVGNALKYSRGRSPARIAVRSSVDESGRTVFSVRDNGVGFDMQYADKLFAIFQRLHRAEDYEGSGVGLAIVARIVGRHGGKVWADSVVDSGSTFYFTLEGAADVAQA